MNDFEKDVETLKQLAKDNERAICKICTFLIKKIFKFVNNIY